MKIDYWFYCWKKYKVNRTSCLIEDTQKSHPHSNVSISRKISYIHHFEVCDKTILQFLLSMSTRSREGVRIIPLPTLFVRNIIEASLAHNKHVFNIKIKTVQNISKDRTIDLVLQFYIYLDKRLSLIWSEPSKLKFSVMKMQKITLFNAIDSQLLWISFNPFANSTLHRNLISIIIQNGSIFFMQSLTLFLIMSECKLLYFINIC